MKTAVLKIDASYRPIGFCSWFNAVSLITCGKANLLEAHDNWKIKSPSREFDYPLVIQIPKVIRLRPLADNRIVKRIVFARDGWECQYCSCSVDTKTATVDHVKPRLYFRREGRPVADANTWDNVVTACMRCNTKKGGRLPFEANMMPKKAPKKPDYIQTLYSGKQYISIHAKYILQYYPSLEGEIFVMDEH